jgi:hypothetical protein
MVTTKPKLKGPPPDMEVPDDIVLKRSSVDPERIGGCHINYMYMYIV